MKKVKVFRSLSTLSHADKLASQLINEAKQFVGSYYKRNSTVPASGLSNEDTEILLPNIIGLSPSHPDFWSKVNLFYTNLDTEIPSEGLSLNISLRDDNNPLSVNNMPENIMDYIRYFHILEHPHVAKNKAEAKSNQIKRFYIENEYDNEIELKMKLDLEEKADSEFYSIKSNESKITEILTLLGVDTRNLSSTVKIKMLKEKIKESPFKFLTAVNDKLSSMKLFIRKCIRAGILDELKTSIIYKEQGETIGETLELAAIFLNDKANSALLKTLTAKVKEVENERKLD